MAQQIALTFDIPIDKDVVRRILASHYGPEPDSTGHSWLTFIGHLKDSLWSIDLFRCESATLRTHWVLGRHGSIHAPDHWVRRPCRSSRRCRTLPDVQSGHSRPPGDAEVPQLRPRSALSIWAHTQSICGSWANGVVAQFGVCNTCVQNGF